MFLFSCNTKLKNKDLKAGFTLIELMITITIVTLVTGIVMANYSSFNSVVLLKSQAYELALDLRSAQVYGVSVGGTTNSFRGAYGIYFDVANGNQNQYHGNNQRNFAHAHEINNFIFKEHGISLKCSVT